MWSRRASAGTRPEPGRAEDGMAGEGSGKGLGWQGALLPSSSRADGCRTSWRVFIMVYAFSVGCCTTNT
ncbi:unnamed protein product, partial [Ectocarpus sp. 6 AP-2014]